MPNYAKFFCVFYRQQFSSTVPYFFKNRRRMFLHLKFRILFYRNICLHSRNTNFLKFSKVQAEGKVLFVKTPKWLSFRS